MSRRWAKWARWARWATAASWRGCCNPSAIPRQSDLVAGPTLRDCGTPTHTGIMWAVLQRPWIVIDFYLTILLVVAIVVMAFDKHVAVRNGRTSGSKARRVSERKLLTITLLGACPAATAPTLCSGADGDQRAARVAGGFLGTLLTMVVLRCALSAAPLDCLTTICICRPDAFHGRHKVRKPVFWATCALAAIAWRVLYAGAFTAVWRVATA